MRTPRRCANCCEVKSIPDDFYTSGKNPNGRQRWKTWCKQCELAYQKLRRLTDPEFKAYHDSKSAGWQSKFHARYLELLKGWRERQRIAHQKPTVRGLTFAELMDRKNQARNRRRNEQLRKTRALSGSSQ